MPELQQPSSPAQALPERLATVRKMIGDVTTEWAELLGVYPGLCKVGKPGNTSQPEGTCRSSILAFFIIP
jgi:hypothetical protein